MKRLNRAIRALLFKAQIKLFLLARQSAWRTVVVLTRRKPTGKRGSEGQ